ncbi:MAG: reverse transcriptase N-terminal domain-containing protein, partial [Candidatus Methanoperedens sp.]|nr:reverse transcriptase N-terminal domain-containing protein [Candidatus Methanoperedens sp.]
MLGRGSSKKRMILCNAVYRGSNVPKSERMLTYSTVFYCVNEGKSMQVRNSITSKDEKLTNVQLRDQWNNIDWKKVEKHVNRLQVRITKAVKEGKWFLVKKLQYLLTHSYYAKLLAVRKPTQNTGKRTAGVDGETWSSSEAKGKAAHNLTDKKYVAKPLKRVFIEKPGKKKKRPLGIPTMYDRAMQSLHALALEPIAEAMGDRTSFGFRKFRSTHDAREQVFVCMCREDSPEWALEGDIKGCFDNISHQWLIDNIPMDKSVLKQFLKAGYIFERQLFPTEAGTPHGGIISPILANITLDGIEKLLADKY